MLPLFDYTRFIPHCLPARSVIFLAAACRTYTFSIVHNTATILERPLDVMHTQFYLLKLNKNCDKADIRLISRSSTSVIAAHVMQGHDVEEHNMSVVARTTLIQRSHDFMHRSIQPCTLKREGCIKLIFDLIHFITI